ncbi:hypothetical protein NQ176_g1256 [Zarea fungicola]|uniref:Uncharacterized protein n=1 Tax=Zarea fungicola TaxID=93591 RepID=A0ACC1NUA1_9HYPO|nr:hypothetical protein NQ176_g1256 [Lecanicillium fungicola]
MLSYVMAAKIVPARAFTRFKPIMALQSHNEETVPFLDQADAPVTEVKDGRIYHEDPQRGKKTLLYSNCAILCITSCIWALILFTTVRTSDRFCNHSVGAHNQDNSPSNTSFFASHSGYLSCGHNRDEAEANGCKYDILTNHWLPGKCQDLKSIEDYQSDGSWWPYADEARTKPLKVEDLGAMDFYYTSMRDHIVHCAMLWKRQYRALAEGWKYVDSITAEAKHTDHCAMFLMKMADVEKYREEPIKVVVGKSGCHVRET